MARTEKRFGAVNQVPGGTTLSELVPTSANRRNLLISATARGTDTITGVVTTGTLASGPSTVISSAQNITTEQNLLNNLGNGSAPYFTLTPNKQVFFAKQSGDGLWSGTYNSTTNTMTAVSNYSAPNYQLQQAFQQSGPSSYGMPYYTNWVKASGRTGGTKQLFLTTRGPRHFVISGNSSYASFHHRYNIADDGNLTNSTIYDYAYETNQADIHQRTTGVFNEHEKNLDGKTGDTYIYKVAAAHPNYPGYNSYDCHISTFQSTAGSWANVLYCGTQTSNTYYEYNNVIMNTMFPYTYNSVYDVYAVQTPITAAMTTFNCSPTSGTFPTITRTTSHGGVRIVQNNGTSHEAWKPWSGTSTELPAPTGVNLDTTAAEVVKALAFSPDGSKLAVAYRRPGSAGTSVADSSIVIYTRQNNGSWVHTHSSGTNLNAQVRNADCMKWSADSSLLGVITDTNKFVVLSFGFGGASTANTATIVGGAPSLNAGTFTATVTHPVGKFLPDLSFTNFARWELISLPTSGNASRWIALGDPGSNSYATNSVQYACFMSASSVATINGITNYVTTAFQSVPLVSGNVTQISGIVLEANERLIVQAGTGGNIDITANGVEIS